MNRRLAKWAPLLIWVAAPLILGAALYRQPVSEVTMAKFSTLLEGRTPNQRYNARLALDALDGAAIAPGETFSFVDRVGTWSRDAGYKKAPVSFNGQLILAWGGGVCQASSTLYNSALLAGLEVTERHQHRHAPSYVPPGRDAAVAFHGIDLKLRNPFPFAVRLHATMVHDRLEIAVLGRQMPSPQPRIVSRIEDVSLPRTASVDRGGPIGRIRNSGKPGFEVDTYLYRGDSKRLLAHSSYPAMTRIVEYEPAR